MIFHAATNLARFPLSLSESITCREVMAVKRLESSRPVTPLVISRRAGSLFSLARRSAEREGGSTDRITRTGDPAFTLRWLGSALRYATPAQDGGSATEYALTTLDVSDATWVNIHLADDGGLGSSFSGGIIHSADSSIPSVGGVVGVKTIELDVTGALGAIKWQASEDNIIWNDIVPEETGSTLDVTTLYPDTPWFRVEAITSVSTSYSTTMKVTSGSQGTLIFIQ